MSTPAQAAANQANARLSTGPRTSEGKAAVARNALRHGLNSTQLLILPGEEAEFQRIRDELASELAPETTIEEVHFNDLLHAVWNKRRVRLLEIQLAASRPDALIAPELAPQFDRLQRHYAHHDRVHHRAQAELRRLQTERLARLPRIKPQTSLLARSHTALNQVWARNFGADPSEKVIFDMLVDPAIEFFRKRANAPEPSAEVHGG
ncbi:MAG: N-succinylarginine dihydrolase [Acidobacteria bacterium]|nr:N-succinylarginine dihydrolase [Acidobacteriota bacterium]